MTRSLFAALFLAALILFAVGALTSLVSAAVLADFDAHAKPPIASCTGPVPHVEQAP